MTIPPWKGGDPEEFTSFIIAKLDAADHERLVEGLRKIADADPNGITAEGRIAFVREIAASGAPAAIIERIGQLFGMDIAEIADQLERLEAVGFQIKGPLGKRGPVSERSDAFQSAEADVPRIRALFALHWGQRNRHVSPTAEAIAAKRWDLSKKEEAALIARFQKKSGLSDG